MDRIDPLYFAVSNRIDVSEETRIKATSEEAGQWAEANKGGELLKFWQLSIGVLFIGQPQHQISFLKSFISAMLWVIMATLELRRHTTTSPSITTNCNATTI